MPTAKMLRDLVQHYPTLYLFNCTGQFAYTLEDLTEFATWVSSRQVVILETVEAKEKEFEYAVLVGQLMALLEPETHVEVISATKSSSLLIDLMRGSALSCSLIQIQDASDASKPKYNMDSHLVNPSVSYSEPCSPDILQNFHFLESTILHPKVVKTSSCTRI